MIVQLAASTLVGAMSPKIYRRAVMARNFGFITLPSFFLVSMFDLLVVYPLWLHRAGAANWGQGGSFEKPNEPRMNIPAPHQVFVHYKNIF
jgi:hypothetical protein